jgi:hypothetical protein
VKDGGKFTKTRQVEGDYKGRITLVEDAKSKRDDAPMWLFTIEVRGETYPHYCKLVENQLWKVRAIFAAAGTVIPKKRMKVDPNKLVGKWIGVTLGDEEYEGRLQSTVKGVLPISEIQNADDEEIDDSEDEDEELEDEVPAAPADGDEEEEEEVEDEEEEEEEEEPPPPPKKKARPAATATARTTATAKKAAPARGKSRVVDDEDLEDLDLEGL